MTLALAVEFTIEASQVENFRKAIEHNARQSVTVEPGCQQFDVCRDPADATRFFLYERYDDEAAIQAHIASPHFREFDALVRDWVRHKAVRTLTVLP